ncbi:mitochondrial inner membrane m-AAA protease component paraplegin, partial [Hetaerina americana]|uniref:mitochondrial inner membrane m-AAA protease component paraplegin n=1 Tax=Hetaerina americana TaxID=62018 RepID=UPI003A7F2EFD
QVRVAKYPFQVLVEGPNNYIKVLQEYRAVISLLHRSGFSGEHQRCLLNNGVLYAAGDKNPSTKRSKSESKKDAKESDGDNKRPGQEDDDDNKITSLLAKAFLWMLTAYMLIAIISLLFPNSNQPEVIRYVSWKEFVHHMLAKGEVEQVIVRPDADIVTIVLHDGAVIKGRKMEHKHFHMNIADTNKFEEKLRLAERRLGIPAEEGCGVPVIYERNSDTAGKLLASLIVVGLILSLISRSRTIRPPISMDTFTQMGRAKFTLVDPLSGPGKGVHFSDVAGLKEAKQEVAEFMDYLKRPEHYRSLGAKVPKGALLLGPPGCGKTLLAKAVATEANVPFLSMNGSEFVEMIGGLGAARVRDLFKEAKKRAPCIIYIDEIDAIGRKRSTARSGAGGPLDGASGEGEQTLNQLLVEMDGMASKEGVLMLASTNRADVLDKALLRPGRFDRHILIDLPNQEERKEIFELHLKVILLEHSPQTYAGRMAALTPGFSGADIANVCNEAALHAARYGNKKVVGGDLEYAIERVVGGTEKRSSVVSPSERKVVACHESGHAIVGWMLPTTDALLKVTIVPRTNMSLGFAQYAQSDQRLYSDQQLFEKMCMALGGRVAESLTFNRVTTGARNDLERVTRMAYAQVRQFGMSEVIGLLSFPEEGSGSMGEGGGSGSFLRKPYSKKLSHLLDQEASKLVAKAYKRTEDLLKEHMDKLEMLSSELLKKETLNYNEIEVILGPPPHGQKHLIEPADFEVSVRAAVAGTRSEAPSSKDPDSPSDEK